MQGLPTEISQLELDVTKDEDVRRVVKEVLVREGHIDILVNNAGAHCCGAYCDPGQTPHGTTRSHELLRSTAGRTPGGCQADI
jgi:NAD(P)-dependent dehydrogenase (short-subunit alcohol dehydrogenase family)